MLHEFSVSTPIGVDLIGVYKIKDGHVIISGVSLEVVLMVVDITVYDVILEWIG